MNSEEREPMSAAASLPIVEEEDRLSPLFAQHYRRVLMAAHRITGNMTDAEDVAQAVFLRLASSEPAAMANTGSYLYRAAINGALDLLRHRKTVPMEPLELAADAVSKAAGACPETEATGRELGRLLRQAIGELPARAAEMFALRYLEEMSNREIAQLMGTSQAVVAVTLYQSRSKLKRRLIELQRGMR